MLTALFLLVSGLLVLRRISTLILNPGYYIRNGTGLDQVALCPKDR
jgi:hypothetical protein